MISLSANSIDSATLCLFQVTVSDLIWLAFIPRAKATWDLPLASVKFVQPDPEIFQRQCLATATMLIIVEPVLNWCGINECLHKLIEVERSIEDWRMKG